MSRSPNPPRAKLEMFSNGMRPIADRTPDKASWGSWAAAARVAGLVVDIGDL
jgi:hypothetical protein